MLLVIGHTSECQTFPNDLFSGNVEFRVRVNQTNERVVTTGLDYPHAFGKHLLYTTNLKTQPDFLTFN
jgi:hypothetical protein